MTLSSKIQEPGLVVTVMAVPPSDWLKVSVDSLPDVKADATTVSEVSLGATVPPNSLLVTVFFNEWSNNGESSDPECLLLLV